MTRNVLDTSGTIHLSTRAGAPGSSRRTLYTGALCLAMLNPLSADASTSIDNLKLYAHSRIINYQQFQCFNKLITAESSWRIDAKSGSHFGLGQMKNTKYRDLDGYRQIDWSIRYQRTRYGSHCNALAFFKKNGWH